MQIIYTKSIHLSSSSRLTQSSGETINLMSNDVSRVFEALLFVSTIYVAIIVIVVVMIILIIEIGYAGVAASVMMTIIVPVQFRLAAFIGQNRRKMLLSTDHRVKLMSEILSGIRIIKLYAWEQPFSARINTARNAEMKQIALNILIKSINYAALFLYPAIVAFVTILVYYYSGHEVTHASTYVLHVANVNSRLLCTYLCLYGLCCVVVCRLQYRACSSCCHF